RTAPDSATVFAESDVVILMLTDGAVSAAEGQGDVQGECHGHRGHRDARDEHEDHQRRNTGQGENPTVTFHKEPADHPTAPWGNRFLRHDPDMPRLAGRRWDPIGS
ncbi:hypothetical protein ACFQ1S_25820, partial [Kibdelosporangium lantanae]